jgi:acetyltransferase-like isoleucine patch superfamily enzyme
MSTYVSARASVHPTAYLGEAVRVYGPTTIGSNCVVEDFAVIGKPDMYALSAFSRETRRTVENYDQCVDRATTLEAGCVIGTGTQVYCGSALATEVETEDYVRIGWDTRVGSRTRVMYRAQVYCGIKIGDDCRIAGFLADNTVVEDRVSFFGTTSHDYPRRTETYEYRPSPRICADAIVAFGAQLIGGVRIGEHAYVGVNAIITRDVPPATMAVGPNRLFPKSEWPGKLREQPGFLGG